ncbi:MAG: PDZ domain-containing protein [bacterium]
MHRPRRMYTFAVALLLTLALQAPLPLTAAAQDLETRTAPPLDLQYTTTVRTGRSERFEVRIHVRHRREEESRFLLPRWAPGAYRFVPWYEGISRVRAEGPDGRPLPVSRDGDYGWLVRNGRVGEFTLSYRVAASAARDEEGKPRLNNRHYLWEQGGLLDGPRTWMYLEGEEERRILARFELPEKWVTVSGLNPTPDPLVFQARDYDWFIDCPVMMGSPGNLNIWRFTSWGVPFTVAYDAAGEEIWFDHEAFVESIKRIADYQASIFGGHPFTHFAFLYDNGGGGGLEHLRSTTIGAPASRLEQDPEARWGVTAHEFFHAWNVKRIRPYVLGPFDYQGANRTESLWVSEGMTNTYTDFTGVRTGHLTPEEFYEDVAGAIASWMGNPAQPHAPPARMSWTVWDGAERNPHGRISYYTQGEVLGIGLDLIIRQETANRRSLDDVFRILMNEHGGKYLEAPGFRTEDLIRVVNDVVGRDMYDFFEDFVYGTEVPAWEGWFAYAGLEYRETRTTVADEAFRVTNTEEGPRVVRVQAGSNAEAAGLHRGDVIVAVGSEETSTAGAAAMAVREAGVGTRLQVRVLREGEEQTLEWAVDARERVEVSIREMREPSPRQEAIREGMLTGTTRR